MTTPHVIDLLRLRELTVEQRIDAVDQILASLTREEQDTLSDATKAELDRRLADSDANPDKRLTWEELRAQVFDQEE